LGDDKSRATGVNDLGQVVGFSVTGTGDRHAFLWDITQIPQMQDLGTLGGDESWAHAINDSGQVVGGSDTGTARHPFLWDEEVMYDLNDYLTPGSSAWTLGQATAISSADATEFGAYIVGWGENPDGQTRAFLATPTPEPASAFLLLLGAPVVYWTRRRRKTNP